MIRKLYSTKISPSIKNLRNEKRLECLNLTTLQNQRLPGNLIQKFNIEKGPDKVDKGPDKWVRPSPMSAYISYRIGQDVCKYRRMLN